MTIAKVPLLTSLMFVAMMAGTLEVMAGQNGRSQIVSFDLPGAGTGTLQGTGCFGCTFSINQSGEVVGTYLDADNVFHGFIRGPLGHAVNFEAPGADTTSGSGNGTWAQGINDRGEITGYYADVAGVAHGFVRTADGKFVSFDAPGAAYLSIPEFINSEGAVVGYDMDAGFLFHAFVRYPNGTSAAFVGPGSCTSGTPAGCYGSEATSVGINGTSVGNYADSSPNLVQHGLLRTPDGKLRSFDAPGAGTGPGQGTGCPGCNMGVNFWGVIVGSYSDANNVFHGFLRAPDGKFITFDAPGAGAASNQGTGCPSDCPVSLNDLGFIVGSYADSAGAQHGYLRTPAGSFETIDPSGSILTQPEGINDWGIVAGYYLDANLVWHGFVRLP